MKQDGSALVELRDNTYIYCELSGHVTTAMVQEAMRQTGMYVNILRAKDIAPRLMLNVSAVTSTSSGARSTAKDLATLGFERVAVWGKHNIIMMIGQYIVRSSKMNHYTRFFKNQSSARSWLLASGHKKVTERLPAALVGGIAVGLIGLMVLIGWQCNNPHLTRLLTTLRPMNPMSAVGFLILSAGMLSMWRNKLRPVHWFSGASLCLGVSALLPLHIDTLLYGDRVSRLGAHTHLSDSTAVCFILLGLIGLLAGRRPGRIDDTRYLLAVPVMILAVGTLFGDLYARDFMYGISSNFVMSFGSSLALTIASSSLILIGLRRRGKNVLGSVSRLGWLIAAALVGVQMLTYIAWSQTISRNQTEAHDAFRRSIASINTLMTTRIDGYINALNGFQGLFAASSSVSQGDFQTYADTTGSIQRYPGARSIVFLQAASTDQIPALVRARRQDTTYFPAGNPTFTVKNQSAYAQHFILVYSATDETTNSIGLDLTSLPGRYQLYSNALRSGKIFASGEFIIAADKKNAAAPGFVISMPVKEENTNYNGLVLAAFGYKELFTSIFQNSQVAGVSLRIQDAGNTIYRSGTAAPGNGLTDTLRVPVVGRTWDVTVRVPQNFGLNSSQTRLPVGTLATGQLFSLLLVVTFVGLSRSRRQALLLAEEITEDLHNERDAAVAMQQKDDAILSSIGDAVFAIDLEGRLTLFNPAAAHKTGYSYDEAIGKPYKDILRFVHKSDGRLNDSFIRQALKGHITSMKNHTQLIRKDGSRIDVADSAAPISDATKTITGVIVVFRDVSKEQALDAAKTEFVSLASHQLRTPLSAINWYSELLLSGDAGKLTKDQKEYLQQIFEGNQRMIDLVNSLLDVSRLDLGKFTNTPQPTSLVATVQSLVVELQGSVDSKHIDLTTRLAKGMPALSIDPKLLRMVVQNLLSNAVKYSFENGSVTLHAQIATDEQVKTAGLGRADFVLLEVADTGCGIPKRQQDKIFSKLFRADNVQGMDVEGTGLGLYIVREVVEKLGGKVWFVSAEGQGTTFSVLLPVVTKATKSNT